MTRDTPLNLRYGHPDTVSVSILMLEIILILSVAGCSMVAAGAASHPDLDFSGLDPNEVIQDEPAPPEISSPSTSESEASVEVPVLC